MSTPITNAASRFLIMRLRNDEARALGGRPAFRPQDAANMNSVLAERRSMLILC